MGPKKRQKDWTQKSDKSIGEKNRTKKNRTDKSRK